MQIAKELLTRIWTSIFFTTSFSDFTQGASCIKKTGGVLPHYLLVLFVFCKTDGAQNKTRKWVVVVVVVVVVAAPVLLTRESAHRPITKQALLSLVLLLV
jgi:hypothetical protein